MGYCLETGCENKTCPAGQVCVGGQLPGRLPEGVTCPGGQECMMGKCTPLRDARRRRAGGLGRPGRVRDPRGTAVRAAAGGATGAGGVTTSGAAGSGTAGTAPARAPDLDVRVRHGAGAGRRRWRTATRGAGDPGAQKLPAIPSPCAPMGAMEKRVRSPRR